MLVDIIEARIKSDYVVFLRFSDGKSGEIDISKIVPFEGVFSPLEDINYFNQMYLNKEIGTICWPNNADISPDSLHKIITDKLATHK